MLTRTLLFLFGLMTLASGIAVVTHAGLGTSTISSMAFVLTNAFDLSMGTFVFLTNVFFFCLQTLVDRTHFLTKFLKQIPICFVFGIIFDVAFEWTAIVNPSTYALQIFSVLGGSAMMGLGIASMVYARLAILPPEGFILSIIHRFGGSFGNLRVALDVSLVLCAALSSWLLLGRIDGLREGTLIAALTAGQFAKLFLECLPHLIPTKQQP